MASRSLDPRSMVSLSPEDQFRLQNNLPADATVKMETVDYRVVPKVLALHTNFDGDFTIDGTPLLLEPEKPTNPTLQTGLRVWDCGMVLAKYIEASLPSSSCQGLAVLELGCGTGIAGLALALKGADVTLTDLPCMADPVMRHVELNAEAVASRGGQVTFMPFDWRRLKDWTNPKTFDLVIASDCVWHATHVPAFTEALKLVCAKDPTHCRALVAHKVRTEDTDKPFFDHLINSGLTLTRMPLLPEVEVPEGVNVWEIRLASGGTP